QVAQHRVRANSCRSHRRSPFLPVSGYHQLPAVEQGTETGKEKSRGKTRGAAAFYQKPPPLRRRAPSVTRSHSLEQHRRCKMKFVGAPLVASSDGTEAKIVNDPRAQLRRGVAQAEIKPTGGKVPLRRELIERGRSSEAWFGGGAGS